MDLIYSGSVTVPVEQNLKGTPAELQVSSFSPAANSLILGISSNVFRHTSSPKLMCSAEMMKYSSSSVQLPDTCCKFSLPERLQEQRFCFVCKRLPANI